MSVAKITLCCFNLQCIPVVQYMFLDGEITRLACENQIINILSYVTLLIQFDTQLVSNSINFKYLSIHFD